MQSILLPQHTDGALAISFAVMTDSLHAALALAETLKDMSPTQMDTYVQAAAPAMGALGAFAAFATLLVSDVVVEALPNTCSYYKAHAYSGEAFPWGEVTWSERIGVGASDRAVSFECGTFEPTSVPVPVPTPGPTEFCTNIHAVSYTHLTLPTKA